MLHIQKTVENWDEVLSVLPSGCLVKVVDQGQLFRQVKAANPRLVTCLRHHYDSGQVFGGSWAELKDRAFEFFSSFVDSTFLRDIAPYCDFVEDWNEYLANSQTAEEVEDRLNWARAAADVWFNRFRSRPELAHIRLVLCNTAVGNWIDYRFAEIARIYDCAIGYHAYDYWSKNIRGEEGFVAATSMLWDAMEFDWGINVDWLFTEAGPFESCVDGWRSPNCLDGDRDRYYSAVIAFIKDLRETPAFKEGRLHGFALFTTGRTSDSWRHFWTEQPELNLLADALMATWYPVPGPNEDYFLEDDLWSSSIDNQLLSLNPVAALQKRIFADGFVPVMCEHTYSFDGREYVYQAAEHLDQGRRRVYYCQVGDWSNIFMFERSV